MLVRLALAHFPRLQAVYRVRALQRGERLGAFLAYLERVGEEEEHEMIAPSAEALRYLDHVAFAEERAVRGDQMRRAVVDLVEDVEHRQLPLGFPLVLVYVRHHLLDTADRSFQRTVVRVVLLGMLKNICKKEKKKKKIGNARFNTDFSGTIDDDRRTVISPFNNKLILGNLCTGLIKSSFRLCLPHSGIV